MDLPVAVGWVNFFVFLGFSFVVATILEIGHRIIGKRDAPFWGDVKDDWAFTMGCMVLNVGIVIAYERWWYGVAPWLSQTLHLNGVLAKLAVLTLFAFVAGFVVWLFAGMKGAYWEDGVGQFAVGSGFFYLTLWLYVRCFEKFGLAVPDLARGILGWLRWLFVAS